MDKKTEALKCKHAWKNVSSKRQTVYQCELCGIYTFEQPANQLDDINVVDIPAQQQEKNKKTEALKLAMEALDELKYIDCSHAADDIYYKALAAINEALAEPEMAPAFRSSHAYTVGFQDGKALAQQQEPYGWKVDGVNALYRGEFAEHDAKADAKRIGGTCTAFPLYTSPPARKPLTDGDIEKLCPQFEDPMRREMWIIGFNAALKENT